MQKYILQPKIFKRAICLLINTLVFAGLFAQTARLKYNFNPSWKLMVGDIQGAEAADFNDENWKSVTLPHAWNEDAAFKVAIDQHPTGIAWYRKHFIIPKDAAGKKVFIEFEGVRQAGEFYLNGKPIGLHENGITAFGFDITSLIKFGEENVIAARIDNSWDYREKTTNTKFQWSDKNFNANYGGISKNVWLHITDKLHQTLPLYSFLQSTGTYIYAKDFDIKGRKATVVAEAEVKNEKTEDQRFTYEVEVKDLNDKVVKVFQGGETLLKAGESKIVSASARLSDLNFWSWGYGYLYTVSTRLKVKGTTVDEVPVKTGFRKVEYKNGMVYLNDRVLMMKGYAQRTSNEWPAIGLSVSPWLSDYSNGLMVESNANLVRWMHITPWKQDIESCDRVGLIQAMPAGDAEADVQGTRWEQRVKVMRDAIIYNRNSPSIFFYECGNESISEEHMAEMKAIKYKYDPNGGRAIGSREMLDSKVAEYGGEMLYINKSADIPLWATEYSRDEGLRKYWDEFSPPYHKDGDGPLYRNAPAKEYNRNQDSHAIEDVVRWFDYWKERPGTGERASSGGVNIIFSDSNTHFRGAENYRRSGEVDALRIAKDGFYAHQVMWDGWVDPEKYRVHIIGHWNYKPGTVKDINVVASGEKTELFINGKSMGFGSRSNNFLFTFKNIVWQSGLIKAITYDTKGKAVAENEIKTAGEPAALRLTTQMNPTGFKADGADLVLAQIEVVDKDGNRCPTALNMINFKLDGEAEWRGGLAQGPDNYILSKSLPVECGVNRVLIRSTTRAGQISLTAESEGLKTVSVAFKSVPVTVEGGLSLDMPADGLQPAFRRGPTPTTSSFIPSRKTLKIAAVTAGANADKAVASYDDNELSDWVNDGKLNTAWITYTLKEAAIVNEVNLKLNNFRTRVYPLQILVDDKIVFDGNTEKGLGYYLAKCKPVKGKKVTVRLNSENSGKDDSNIGTEMGGKKLDDGVARTDGNSKGSLSIIEAEIYQKI
ncbi:glycoside hydrolase family 2 protein [Desertivirga arenae]|uniref:glycoside hydrolase family 2 protein n=1 Tax=Desertivirga arenae TaxID=2810309 RepID=UPI001A96A16A|nr:sugar-binding domain-containing protein [Pedobacter sp. SYSU D00823]